METNFDYLLEKKYADFAVQAVEAEKSIVISPATCAILSRRALELAVRFVFSYDAELKLPYQDNVSSLIHERTFRDIIQKVQQAEFWDHTTIIELDMVRTALRDLLQYLDKKIRRIYYTDFTDTIIAVTEGEPVYDSNDLKNYRKKVEFYLKEHGDKISVYKLRNNKQLSEGDLKELERILWRELGLKEDYVKEYGDTPIGRLVRQIIGVDRAAVNEAFGEFLTEERLNINQIRFVNLIVDYIVTNGNIDDNKVLMEEPFRSVGSITTLFKDDMGTAKRIMEVVADIKRNSEEIA